MEFYESSFVDFFFNFRDVHKKNQEVALEFLLYAENVAYNLS